MLVPCIFKVHSSYTKIICMAKIQTEGVMFNRINEKDNVNIEKISSGLFFFVFFFPITSVYQVSFLECVCATHDNYYVILVEN